MIEISKMKEKYPKFFKKELDSLLKYNIEGENENYFNLEESRKRMQVFDFEEKYNEKLSELFARKLAFSNS